MGQLVVKVRFRQEINSICKGKKHQIDTEIVENLEVFIVFDAISVQFPKEFVIRSNTINNEKPSFAMVFSEENVAAFCFKNTSKVSTSLFMCNLCTL